jgi:D-aminopeptidase
VRAVLLSGKRTVTDNFSSRAYTGVHVGQNTVGEDGDDARKGLTVIFPRHPDSITVPCYAGMHTLNGNGEVTGSYQIKDWGFTNTV